MPTPTRGNPGNPGCDYPINELVKFVSIISQTGYDIYRAAGVYDYSIRRKTGAPKTRPVLGFHPGVNLTPGFLDYGLPAHQVLATGRVQRASSDEELMAQFADSLDERSFSLLAERYNEKAHRVALAILGNEEAAADAVQESFLRIVRARSTYRTDEPYRQWYFCILRNICRDELRRKKIVDPTVPAGLSAQGFDPKDRIEKQEACEQAVSALARLPEHEREALTLRLYANMDFQTIADTLDIAVDAAKKRVYRGLDHLRKNLT